ncbi:MAG: glycoside hydrolase family 3 protein [Actinomycetota bacterium]|nr:glycoside hydrolase family 3 protein [Actinomycetota bacterium]
MTVASLALAACGGTQGRSGAPTTAPSAPRTSTTSVPTTTPVPSPSTSGPPTTAPAKGCVPPPSSWPATRVADQLLMVIGEFTSAASLAAEADAGVGGFVFLGEPSAAARTALRAALGALDADAAGAGQVQPWMSTDTEGGPVSRLANVLGSIPSARSMAAQWTPAQVESAMEARGRALLALGVTMDLAPVLDVAAPTDPVADESQRSFSATPQVAASYGVAFAAGLRAAGVVAVGKHFPGLGHASADTDTGPATDPPLDQLRSDDLVPFSSAIAAGLPVVMVGHPVVPGLTGGLPASLSPATYALLRRTLHFSGVAMTDALGAGAISAEGDSEPAAAVAAVRAGADMAMVDAGTWQPAADALVGALGSGTLTRAQADASVSRVLEAKRVSVCRA